MFNSFSDFVILHELKCLHILICRLLRLIIETGLFLPCSLLSIYRIKVPLHDSWVFPMVLSLDLFEFIPNFLFHLHEVLRLALLCTIVHPDTKQVLFPQVFPLSVGQSWQGPKVLLPHSFQIVAFFLLLLSEIHLFLKFVFLCWHHAVIHDLFLFGCGFPTPFLASRLHLTLFFGFHFC